MSISANPRDIRALAFDLDGTILAPGAVLTERTRRAIRACVDRGLKVIITTGRAILSTEPVRSALELEGPMVYFNGAVVADMPRGGILSSILLDRSSAEFCVDLSRETGVYCQVFFPGSELDSEIRLMADREGPEQDLYFSITGLRAERNDLREALGRSEPQGCIKTMFIGEPEVLGKIRPRLMEHFGKNIYIVQTMGNFLEVLNMKVSKGQGLLAALKHYSIGAEETIAFGDEENDIPLFEAAGYSVAPSNAKEALRAAADLVVGSNAEDGVAVFLEEFFGLEALS